MSEEVVAIGWWSPLGGLLGAVVLIDAERGYWKAYLGHARGGDPESDAVSIARRGARLDMAIALHLAAIHQPGLALRLVALRHLE